MGDTVRDLEKDLEICETATPGPIRITNCNCGRCNLVFISLTHSDGRFDPQDATFIVEARTGWPHAIKRAIEAEKRIDQLQDELLMLYDSHNRGWPIDCTR